MDAIIFNNGFNGLNGWVPLFLLLFGEVSEQLNLCFLLSVGFFDISNLWGLIISLEETKDHRRG